MRLVRSAALAILCTALMSATAVAQAAQPSTAGQAATPGAASTAGQAMAPTHAAPAAKSEDVQSVDAIVKALYDVISGPAGTRDWDRFRSLFAPEGRLIPNGVKPTGEWSHRVLTVEDFVQRAGTNMKNEGFFESGVSNKVEQYGSIAHVFSTYESRHEKDGKPFARGINSFSLASDGKRWYVVQILWQSETPAEPIPEKYLTK
jgi:hypothetical protein